MGGLQCVSEFYTPLAFCWKSGISSKFWKILAMPWMLTNLNKNKAKKKIFGKKNSKKPSFSTTTKSWTIFSKISQIGPWVSRIEWWEGHQLGPAEAQEWVMLKKGICTLRKNFIPYAWKCTPAIRKLDRKLSFLI